MKQTNNAIKFLLAQYRAIFKQAYLKGLVSAAVLTAGLAAGATANADPVDVTQSGKVTVDTNNTLVVYTGPWNADVTVVDTTGSYGVISNGSPATVSGNGTLTINASSGKTAEVKVVTNNSNDAIDFNIKSIDVKNGTLSVQTLDVGGSTNSGSVTVAADVINIGGSAAGAKVSLNATGSSATLTLGRQGETDRPDSAITIDKGGLLSVDGTNNVKIVGERLDIKNGGVMDIVSGSSTVIDNDSLNVDSKSFLVVGDGTNTVSSLFSGSHGEISGGLLVNAKGTLQITTEHNEGEADFNDKDTPAYEPSTDDIVGNVTFKSGANIQIGDSGAIIVSNGTLTIEDGVKLNAIAKDTQAPLIQVYANAGNANTDEVSTLKISSDTLESFLRENDEFNKIEKDSNGAYKLSKEPVKDVAGSLMLVSGAFVEFSDEAQIDLAQKFKFSSGNASVGGSIVVDPNLASTIYGKNIAVSDILKNSGGTTAGDLKLNIEADALTLGSSNFDSAATPFNVALLKAHDSINFQSKGDTFVLQNSVELNRADDETVGSITGEALNIGTASSSGILKVTGGTFKTAGQTITLIHGVGSNNAALQVTSQSGDPTTKDSVTYYQNPTNTYLTIDGGKFVLAGSTDASSATVEVKGVKGADATLDLTQTSITWGKGTINVTGGKGFLDYEQTQRAGYGVVKITGDQFKNFIDSSSSQTLLGLGDNSILDINGAITGDVTFDKFADKTGNSAADPGVVSFTGDGTLQTNGELSLVATDQTKTLDIGAGKISAQAITISDKNIDKEDKGTEDDKVTVAQGTLQVQNRISSNNKTIVFGDAGSGGILKLESATVDGTGLIANDVEFNENSALRVKKGNWELSEGKDITLNQAVLQISTATDDNNEDVGSSLKGDNLAITANNTSNAGGNYEVEIQELSSAKFNTIQTLDGSRINVDGTLTILGRGDIDTSAESTELDSVQDAAETAGVDLTGTAITVSGSNAKLEFGNTATSKLVTVSSTKDDTDGYIKVADELGEVTLESGAQLRLNFTSGDVFTAEMAKELKEEAVAELNNGFINIGSGSLSIKYDVDNETAPETSWDNVKDFVQIESDVANDKLLKTLITDIDAGDVVSGHYGALQTNFDGNTSVQVDGRLTLHTARDGYFVSNKGTSGRTAVGVSLQSDSYFATYGAGKLGAITSTANTADVTFTTESGSAQGPVEVQGAITGIDELTVDNDAIVAGNITANYLDLSKSLSNEKFDSKFESMAMLQGSSFTTNNLTLIEEDAGSTDPHNESLVAGDLKVANDLTIKAAGTGKTNTLTIAGGTVYANGLILNSGAALVAGYEGIEVDSDPKDGFDETQSYTGRFSFAYADLSDGGIILDPLSTLPTSVGSISTFADGKSFKAEDLKAGTVNGKLFVGMNSALGIGTADDKAVDEAIAKYQSNGALNQYGALVVVDKAFTLDTGDGLTMTAQSVSDFEKYMENKPFTVNSQYHTIANTVYFGEDTAMIINADALNKAADRGEALVTFTDNNAQLIADGGEIILSGDVRARRTYTFFKDGDGKVSVVDINGKTDSGAAIQINTENGFLFGEINNDNGGTLTLQVNTDRAILGGASDPVYASLVAYAQGYNGDNEEDKLFYGYTKNEDGSETPNYTAYDNYFLNEAISYGNGADAEKAARLAVYGGAAQAALTAGTTTYEAVNSRMGMGAQTGSVTFADNGQGAGLWVTPIYKSHDSDGFEAQGLSYGADMDLYGVALGGDYTLDNGMRFGAAFNVGSGDADGQGAGNGVSNDFDYYGFTVYGGYTWDKLSIVADVSYTSVDNDVEANTQFEKISASMDSTSLSFGVTGQYTFDINGMNVTPHAGMRFTNIDMDDYTVKGVEEIAKYNGDSANIFSIPVGVTVSKEFVSGAWTVKPAFDLTLTANVGDDSVDGSVTWAGVDNLKTNLESEIIDSFTYGATLGVSAKTGNFTMGLGVNYTGASSADEYGVSANARFVF